MELELTTLSSYYVTPLDKINAVETKRNTVGLGP